MLGIGAHVRLVGLELFGATLRFDNCSGCVFSDVALRFPTFDREVRELKHAMRT